MVNERLLLDLTDSRRFYKFCVLFRRLFQLHLVFYNTKYKATEAAAKHDGLAVIGVFLKVGIYRQLTIPSGEGSTHNLGKRCFSSGAELHL